MKPIPKSHRLAAILAFASVAPLAPSASAQTPFADLPPLSAAQNSAVNELESGLQQLSVAVATARSDLRFATYATPTDTAEIRAKAAALKSAEQALATARAEAFATLQSSPNRLSSQQVEILVWQGIRPNGGRRFGGGGRGRGGPPPADPNRSSDGFAGLGRSNFFGGGNNQNFVPVSDTQQTAIAMLNEQPAIAALIRQVAESKRAAIRQIYATPQDKAAIAAKVGAWLDAEGRLAETQGAEFAKFQASSPYRLNAAQVNSFATGNLNLMGL